MSYQSINFKDFMKNDYVIKKRNILPLLSVGTVFSPTTIFNPPPLIAKAYFLMIALGLMLIAIAFLEKHLAFSGLSQYAKVIFDFIQTAMPFVMIGALIVFVYLNPLL